MKRIESITLEQMSANDPTVMQGARQPGGVRVVDDRGVLQFTLSIPSSPLPVEHCLGCRCKDDRNAPPNRWPLTLSGPPASDCSVSLRSIQISPSHQRS